MALVELQKVGDVFTLTMNAGENSWNTAPFGELTSAFDEVEQNNITCSPGPDIRNRNAT
jgi:hypothetical protein